MTASGTRTVHMVRHRSAGPDSGPIVDGLAAEEPLEMRVEGQSVATRCTPGHDLDLTTGFLLTEGVIDGADDIHAMAHVDDPAAPKGNTVDTVLAAGVPAARARSADRAFYASSSCGLCGKASIDRIFARFAPLPPPPALDLAVLHTPSSACAPNRTPSTARGPACRRPLPARRHPAAAPRRHRSPQRVDKVIGAATRAELDLSQTLLVVSGRAGFEIVQKAVVARIPVLAAVGALVSGGRPRPPRRDDPRGLSAGRPAQPLRSRRAGPARVVPFPEPLNKSQPRAVSRRQLRPSVGQPAPSFPRTPRWHTTGAPRHALASRQPRLRRRLGQNAGNAGVCTSSMAFRPAGTPAAPTIGASCP